MKVFFCCSEQDKLLLLQDTSNLKNLDEEDLTVCPHLPILLMYTAKKLLKTARC